MLLDQRGWWHFITEWQTWLITGIFAIEFMLGWGAGWAYAQRKK